MGPSGGYYDAQDSGPDQYQPTSSEAAAANPPAPPTRSTHSNPDGSWDGTTDGVTGYGNGNNPFPGRPMPVLEKGPNFPGYDPGQYDPNAPKYGYNDPKPNQGNGNGSYLMPGDGGWSMDGGKGGSIDAILKQLMAKYGSNGSVAGIPVAKIVSGAQAKMQQQQMAGAAPQAMGLGRLLGGSLFG